MITTRPITEHGDAELVLTLADGTRHVDQLDADPECNCIEGRVTCHLCDGSGCTPGSFDSPRRVICGECGGSGAVDCGRCAP